MLSIKKNTNNSKDAHEPVWCKTSCEQKQNFKQAEQDFILTFTLSILSEQKKVCLLHKSACL